MKDLFDLSNKVAIVTGAGGVLGGEAARYLAAQNVRVVLLGRTLQSLEKTLLQSLIKEGVLWRSVAMYSIAVNLKL